MKIYLVEWGEGYSNVINGDPPIFHYYDQDDFSDESVWGFDDFQLEKINSLKENESVLFKTYNGELKITLSSITEFNHLGDYK